MLSKELLERFKRGEVVFHTPTQEIFYKVAEDAEVIGCNCGKLYSSVFDQYEEFTGIDYENKHVITYSPISYYKEDYPQLEIVKLSLGDFSEPSAPLTRSQAESADIQRRLVEITRAIAYCRKLEETYDADLELDGLYTAREEILRELEDSLAIHL